MQWRSRHVRKPIAVSLLVVALLCSFFTHVTAHSHIDLDWNVLPDIGSLDILPSGPSAWLAVKELATAESEPTLAALPPRGPPVSI